MTGQRHDDEITILAQALNAEDRLPGHHAAAAAEQVVTDHDEIRALMQLTDEGMVQLSIGRERSASLSYWNEAEGRYEDADLDEDAQDIVNEYAREAAFWLEGIGNRALMDRDEAEALEENDMIVIGDIFAMSNRLEWLLERAERLARGIERQSEEDEGKYKRVADDISAAQLEQRGETPHNA